MEVPNIQFENLHLYQARIDYAKALKRDYPTKRQELAQQISLLVAEKNKLDSDYTQVDSTISEYTKLYEAQVVDIQNWDSFRPARKVHSYISPLAKQKAIYKKLKEQVEKMGKELENA